jgi:GT2 family glycosyltransferase
MDSGAVGFVVIGRNEGDRLIDSLRSVLALSNRVVYADSASTDGSAERARALGAIVAAVPPDGPMTAARGRNVGYALLRERFPDTEFVQFIDGDCILDPGFVPKALRFMRDHERAGLVCGRRYEAHPDASLYNRLCDDEWNTPVGLSQYSGGDALVRVAAFDEVGGYRSDLPAGEEPEMTSRMRAAGWQIWRIDANMTEHDARIMKFGQWWQRAQRGGFAYAEVWRMTRGLPQQAFARQLGSALLWTVAIPAAVLLLALAFGSARLLLLLPLIYAVQIVRIAAKNGIWSLRSWQKASMMLLSKLPELAGAIRFVLRGRVDPSEYKVSR